MFCGVCAYNTPKTPDFTHFHSYIIETHISDSTMNKRITNRFINLKTTKLWQKYQ